MTHRLRDFAKGTVGLVVLLALVPPRGGFAQVISLKTVPIPTGDQFVLYPSRSLGMGGVSIALEDPFADAFANPAKGARQVGSLLFVSPTIYNVSDHGGAGRSFSTGGLYGHGSWFGGGLVAVQQLDVPVNDFAWFQLPTAGRNLLGEWPTNLYVQALVGMRLPGTHVSLGASVYRARLRALQGVERLYSQSWSITQDGDMTDLRLGLLAEQSDGGWVEAALVHDRVDMTHDVTYVDFLQDPGPGPGQDELWVQENQSRTRTTGLQLGVVRPLAAAGWRIGGLLTVNRKTHPKIPNYDVAGIPRDPGNSTAYDLGIGIARQWGKGLFGLDLVYQPARSHTWAEAGEPALAADGTTIAAGGHTIDNWFHFSNLRIATGISQTIRSAGFQLGLSLLLYDYSLRQVDHFTGLTDRTHEGWIEWAPTWGGVLRFSDLEVRYSGRLAMKGFPSLLGGGRDFVNVPTGPVPLASGDDYLVPITRPTNLPDYATFTNQLSVVIPIGGTRR